MGRAFVLGNGESLKHTNLDNLIGETVFGCNNIHMIYPYTKMRVTHYVRAEEAGTLDESDWGESVEVHKALECEMWVNEYFMGGRHKPGVNEIKSCAHYRRHYDNPNCPHLLHLPILCTFGSSVNVAIQIAMLKQYSPIYLIGCDLDSNMKHFSEHYRHGKEQANRYAQLDTLYAHMIAARSGYPIFNATVGGELEVYERINFESLDFGNRPIPERYTPEFIKG
jgi:hypothetical protein